MSNSQSKEQTIMDIEITLMNSFNRLQLLSVALDDANPVLPGNLDLKCSNGVGIEDIYFGAAAEIKSIANDISDAWNSLACINITRKGEPID